MSWAAKGNGKFGTGLALSRDSKWLVVGAPQASNLKTKFSGNFSEKLLF